MPQLSDLVAKRKFVKKEYRPWDLTASGTVDGDKKSAETNNPSNETSSESNTAPVQENAMAQEPQAEPTVPKSDAKVIAKDTGNKLGNDKDNTQVTNKKPIDNNKVTKEEHRDNVKITSREQASNITDNIIGNTNNIGYLVDAIRKLSGIQKNMFEYVLNVCVARGTYDTGNLLSSDLATAANCSIGSAKTSLIRLIDKHIVIRHPGKASRGGHMVLGITKEIQAAAGRAQQALYNPFKMSHSGNTTDNVTNNISPYSSSFNNKNITTTSLPEEWKKIDFEVLSQIGFGEMQLKQLFESGKTDPLIVQESINHFAYGLQNSDKVKAYGSPLNVLMGVLRKGQAWREANYVSPKEQALQQILDEKRKKKEKLDSMVNELVELEFPEWRKKLSEDDIKQIVPIDVYNTKMSAAIQASLRTHFIDHVVNVRLKDMGLIEA